MRSEKMSCHVEQAPGAKPSPASSRVAWPVEVLKRFRLIFKEVQQHSQWVETTCGVSSAQLWAMWELSQCPGLRVTSLAKAMSIHQSTASNLVEKLARKGLLRRERLGRDQRVVSLFLTEAGSETLRLAPPPARGILQHALFNLPEDSLRALGDNLDLLVEAMGITDEEAAMQPMKPLAKARRAT